MPVPPPPSPVELVDAVTVTATLVICGLAVLFALTTLALTLTGALRRERYVSKSSPLRYLVWRARLLTIASVLSMLLALDNALYIYLLHIYRTADFLLLRLGFNLLANPTNAFMTLAICIRCMIIVTRNVTARVRFLRFASAVAITIVATLWSFAISGILSYANQDPPPAAAQWFKATFIPAPVIGLSLAFPVLSVGGSVWALRTTFQGGGRDSPSTAGSGTRTFLARMTAKLPLKTSSSSISFTSSSTAPAAAAATMVAKAVAVPSSHMRYPLSNTFILLSAIQIAGWMLAAGSAVMSRLDPIRSQALMVMLQAGGLLVEALFERIMKASSQRARGQQQYEGGTHFQESAPVVHAVSGMGPSGGGNEQVEH
ncbi:hypothetical protein BC828DRAFT_377486 [Blastocladiella britannica]|nr:hypothetical protein BC828DRAFT_377486 [Blastocladiella britannica]